MARFLKSRKVAEGASPGSLIFIGSRKVETPGISITVYDKDKLEEQKVTTIADAISAIDPDRVSWINIDGIHDSKIMGEIGTALGIRPLALENIMNTGLRPRLTEYDGYSVIICKALDYDDKADKVIVDQVAFLIKGNVLISFQERPGDIFEAVRQRIRQGNGKIRLAGTDYLLFALMDSIVDDYLIDIERIGSRIEDLELQLYEPGNEISRQLYKYKTETSFFRKAVRPIKDVMIALLKQGNDIVAPDNRVFFFELSDLTEQTIEAIENYSTMINDQLNIYNIIVTNRVNEIVRVLTIFSAIFIPLTFLAGVYGMNFEYLPELSYKYAYFIVWGVMISIAIVMLYIFKKRKWF